MTKDLTVKIKMRRIQGQLLFVHKETRNGDAHQVST
jgi:hypothetical protein